MMIFIILLMIKKKGKNILNVLIVTDMFRAKDMFKKLIMEGQID